MLCHRPNLFPLCARAGAQLVLSGHTHGGQIALSRTLTPARLLGPYTMGFFREHGSQLYVHRGLGVVGGMPLRLGSAPEIALLTLRRS
jgi:predicted MPP superfamily phosphohydrolase